jgi:hypothetical protein
MRPHVARRARAALPVFLVLSLPYPLAANEIFDARGFNPNRPSSTQLPFEHIDPLTGNLLLVFTDLTLPGNAGFDLAIQRTYNSTIFRDDETFSTIDWDSWAGVGWSMHLGRVRTQQDDTPLAVEMPDGSSHKLFPNFVGNSALQVTRDYWLYNRNANPPTLQLPNGVVYTFNKIVAFGSGNYYRYPTRIQDPFGNKIEIEYGSLTPGPGCDPEDHAVPRGARQPGFAEARGHVYDGNRQHRHGFPLATKEDGLSRADLGVQL